MPVELVQLMAQLSDHPGVYTNLQLPFGIGLDKKDNCPLRKLKLPKNRFKWHVAGARANPLHIFLGEASVWWSLYSAFEAPDSSQCVYNLKLFFA